MEVTTTAGAVMNFDPARVYMLTGPLPTDGSNVVFYLHGVSPAPIPQLPGTIAEFVPTMPNGSNFAKLTIAKTGASFYVNAKLVRALGAVASDEQAAHPGANTAISLGGKYRYVSETVDAAKEAIDAA